MENLKNDILKLIDPSVNMTIKDTKGLNFIGLDEDNDIVNIDLLVEKKIDETEILKKEIIKLVKIKYQHKGIKINIEEKKVHESIVNSGIACIGIISGKGGVGKSSVAANIAYRLIKKGYQTALIDADIYGSSIPDLFNIDKVTIFADENQKIIPYNYKGLEIMSTDFFTNNHEPVIWRASMLHSMLDYFFYETAWNKKTRVIIIDFPPGTGDVMLDVNNYVKNPKMLLVTTPHPSAAMVATKAGIASQKMNQEILGVIENMSYFQDTETAKKYYIFGKDGGISAAKNLNTELLAQIPISVPKYNKCVYEIDEEAGKIYDEICDFLIFNMDIKK